jgi:type IV pilus assembly protein PilC
MASTAKKPTASSKLNPFQWDGLDSRSKKTSGEIHAKDLNMARAILQRQGIRPTKIRAKKAPLFAAARSKALSEKDVSFFTRQLATMLEAGVPLVTALDIIGRGHKNPEFTKLLNALRIDVESGTSLSDAFAQHPKYFDNLFVNLVAAGELSGTLDDVLSKIADYKEKTLALKAKVKRAMIYPASILVAAVVVTLILLIYVIPVFEELFQSVGADLPALTRWVIGISNAVAGKGWMIMFGVVIVILILVRLWKRSEKFQRSVGKLTLKLPGLGQIMHNAALARYARTMTTTFGAGVPIMESLASVAATSGNAIFSDAILRMRDGIASGQSLNFTMQQEPLFPVLLQQMTSIGEESGSLEHMMDKAATYYEEEVDAAVEILTSLMEPLIIAVIGVIVGTLVIAMYLPIFHLGDAF